jgi:hypothetical protein
MGSGEEGNAWATFQTPDGEPIAGSVSYQKIDGWLVSLDHEGRPVGTYASLKEALAMTGQV